MAENTAGFDLHQPNPIFRTLEKFHIRDVRPGDICPAQELPVLYEKFPYLLGDQYEIDAGMGGRCQSWRDNPGWWKNFIAKYSAPQIKP